MRARSIKRSSAQLLRLHETVVPDPREFFRGNLKTKTVCGVVAISPTTGEEISISEDELRVLAAVPSSEWTSVSTVVESLGVVPETVEGLLRKGLLVSDRPSPSQSVTAETDARQASVSWFPSAAAYHFTSKWRDRHLRKGPALDSVEFGSEVRDQLLEHVSEHGSAPSHFHQIESPQSRAPLPRVERNEALFSLLLSRKTTRLFDGNRLLSRDDLASILYYTYGCHGLARFSAELSWLKKTSPSGGSMHPIEVYPLVLRVEGVEPGVYHYEVEHHALAQLRALGLHEAEEWANEFCAGQTFVRKAQVLFIMTARFRRCFWKYPNHAKAYRVILLDAGHLSQTFYLVCTQLKLGAFFTSAISERNIEEKLDLDPIEEGAIGVSACGYRDPDPPFPPFEHGPYSPPR